MTKAPSCGIDQDRRRLIGTAALGVAVPLAFIEGARAQEPPGNTPKSMRTGDATFKNMKQVRAGVLNIGYAEAGPTDAPPVVLLHGWPYDIHSFVDVTPRLASAGYRVIVPYLRGYGTTRFLSNDTFRNGQPAALAMDAVELHGRPRDREGDHRADSTGVRAAQTSSRRCGPSAARRSSR